MGIFDDDFNHNEFLRCLGKHVCRIRTEAGYSQDRLCDEAGLARGTVSKIENGLRDSRASTLVRIAEVLGIRPGKLLNFKYD